MFAVRRQTASSQERKSDERASRRTYASVLSMPAVQRPNCACGGGCPRCRQNYPLQAKLEVSQPGDALEQEADRVAEQVLRMPQPEHSDNPEAQKSAGLRLSRYASGTPAQSSPEVAPIVDNVVRSPGEPLDPATRAFMEPRFGYDFSRVRVHSGSTAEQSARGVSASAYTVGHDIVFGAGRFAPRTNEGRRLLAHELTHVVQQLGADGNTAGQSNGKRALSPVSQPVAEGRAVPGSVQRVPADDSDEIEMADDPVRLQSYVFAGDKQLSTDKEFARRSGREAAARIRKSGEVSWDIRLELNRMLAFFEGEAKEAYIQEIKPSLVNPVCTPPAARSSPGKRCKFYVYDSTIEDAPTFSLGWPALAFGHAAFRPGAYVIPSGDSIEEALHLIFTTYADKDCGCTEEVQFWSHGSPGNAMSIQKTDDELTSNDFNIPGLDTFGDGPTSMPGYRAWHDSLTARQRRLVLLRRTICDSDAEIYYRSCSAFQGAKGQDFARASAEFWRSKVVGHTKLIALTQPGKKVLEPCQEPYWPELEGTEEPTPKKKVGVGADQKPKKD